MEGMFAPLQCFFSLIDQTAENRRLAGLLQFPPLQQITSNLDSEHRPLTIVIGCTKGTTLRGEQMMELGPWQETCQPQSQQPF